MVERVIVIVRLDGESWSAWSPQCPGLSIVEPTAAALRKAVPAAVRFYRQGSTDEVDVEFHLERELHGVVVRVAQDQLRWERQLLAERVAAALGVRSQAERMRAAPANALGDVIYVCAWPDDTVRWVTDQMDMSGDAITVVVAVGDEMIWTAPFTTNGDGARMDRDSSRTLAEIMRTDSAGTTMTLQPNHAA